MSLETFLIRERHYCEQDSCMNKAKVCRKIDGHHKVFCWQHDPEQVQDFISWLEQQGDALPVPADFPEYLTRREDSIIS